MRARVDISQVEEDTKIRAKYLRALENEEWGLLPGSVYVKSFLRTYAEYLHIDPRPLLDEYQRRTTQRPEISHRSRSQSRRRSKAQPRTQRQRAQTNRFLSPPVVIVGVLVLILLALAAVGLIFDKNHSHTASTPNSSLVGSTPVTGTTPANTTPKGDKPKKPNPVVTTSTLKIVPTGAVYVCVVSAAGKTLIAKTYSAGETVPTESGSKLLVTLGNANATITVNGKPFALTSTGAAINLRVEHGAAAHVTTGPTCG